MSNTGPDKYNSSVDELQQGLEAINSLTRAVDILADANAGPETPSASDSSNPFAEEVQIVNPTVKIREAIAIMKDAVDKLSKIMWQNEEQNKICDDFKTMIVALEEEISGQTPFQNYLQNNLPKLSSQLINFKERMLAEEANIKQAIARIEKAEREAKGKNILDSLTKSASPSSLFPDY